MVTTRQATDDDLPFLADVFLRSMRVPITSARGFWDEAKERTQFREQLQLPYTRVIEHNGTSVGFLMTLERGKNFELHTLCIAPEHQGHGLGTAVTRQLLDDARARSCGVILSVLKANGSARSLYERLGFASLRNRSIITACASFHRRLTRQPSCSACPVAPFVFLARAAGTRIIAPPFLLPAHNLLNRQYVSGASHARLFQLSTLAAHEGFFQVVGGCRDQPRRMMSVAPAALLGRNSRPRALGVRSASLRATVSRIWRTLDDLHQIEITRRVFLKALQHGLEHFEGFFFVLDQGIVLAIAAQANTFLEVIHAEKVIFPLRVENAEHDDALVMAHPLGADQLFFRVVALF